jgi:DNA-binding transcriptional MerR regulator
MTSPAKKPDFYSIGELARMVDLSQRTIRYYEEIGLLHSVRRMEKGKRVYTDDDVRRLKFINHCSRSSMRGRTRSMTGSTSWPP